MAEPLKVTFIKLIRQLLADECSASFEAFFSFENHITDDVYVIEKYGIAWNISLVDVISF